MQTSEFMQEATLKRAAAGTPHSYETLFLAQDWAHQTYFGWKVSSASPSVRVLSSRRSLFQRHLVLLRAAGLDLLPSVLRSLDGLRGWREIVIHDFDKVLQEHEQFHLRFTKASASERLLNVGTFV